MKYKVFAILIVLLVLLVPLLAYGLEADYTSKTLKGHKASINSVAVSPDGKLVASSSFNELFVQLWDKETGAPITQVQTEINVTAVDFSPDGKVLAVTTWNGLLLFDTKNHKNIASFSILDNPDFHILSDVDFSHDSKLVAASCSNKIIYIWNVNTKELESKLTGSPDHIKNIVFPPDSNTLISTESDQAYTIWDLKTKKPIKRIRTKNNINFLAISPDGKILATSFFLDALKLWDSKTNKITATFKHKVPGTDFTDIAFSPDGKYLVSAEVGKIIGNDIRVYEIETQKEVMVLKGHNDVVRSIDFSRDGKTLVSGCEDNTVKVWTLNLK